MVDDVLDVVFGDPLLLLCLFFVVPTTFTPIFAEFTAADQVVDLLEHLLHLKAQGML